MQKHYGKLHVLQDLHLQVPEGSAFALVGTYGAGKTTTLRMLVNILRPDSGNAPILVKPTSALSHRDFEDTVSRRGVAGRSSCLVGRP